MLTTEAVADRSKAFYTLLLECIDDLVQMGAGVFGSVFGPPLLEIKVPFLSKYNIRIRKRTVLLKAYLHSIRRDRIPVEVVWSNSL